MQKKATYSFLEVEPKNQNLWSLATRENRKK